MLKVTNAVVAPSFDKPALWTYTILQFASLNDFFSFAVLCRRWAQFFSGAAHFTFMAREILGFRYNIYIPPRPPLGTSWRALFFELLPLRTLWKPPVETIVDVQSPTRSDRGQSSHISPTVAAAAERSSFRVEQDNVTRERERQQAERMAWQRSVPVQIPQSVLEEDDSYIGPYFGDGSHLAFEKAAREKARKERPQTRCVVRVFVRFKPKEERVRKFSDFRKGGVEEKEVEDCKKQEPQRTFVLPLHQRLQLIKMRNKVGTRAALRILKKEGGWSLGASDDSLLPRWKKGRSSNTLVDEDEDNEYMQLRSHVHSIDAALGQVVMLAPAVGMRSFTFDGVLAERSSQSQVYEKSARRMVIDLLNGYNATLIMYGQTGSGKTHTMFGPGSLNSSTMLRAERGIVPRACEEIFVSMRMREKRGIECQLSVSYVEVYGRQVSDLLRGGAPVGHSRVSAQRFVLAGNVKRVVENMADVEEALAAGEKTKRIAHTAMNERSSRAHTLFILTLSMKNASGNVHIQSQLFLADLGGSEQVKRSKVSAGEHREGIGFVLGKHMREAIYINSGLLALKHCVAALNRGDDFIPTQNDRLTMLLSPALGGNSKATVVVTASTDEMNATETLQSLRFAEKCMKVENVAKSESSSITSVVQKIDKEIKILEETIQSKERWETHEERKIDELAEPGTYEAKVNLEGGEVVRVGKLVGAEAERERLEELILKRAELTGENVEDFNLAQTGFGGKYGKEQASALGGHSAIRFQESSRDKGLLIGGRKTAKWDDDSTKNDFLRDIKVRQDEGGNKRFIVRVARGTTFFTRDCGDNIDLAKFLRQKIYHWNRNGLSRAYIRKAMKRITVDDIEVEK